MTSTCAAGFGSHSSTRSHPAPTASTAAGAAAWCSAIAPIAMSSVTTSPSYPSSLRSRPVISARDSVAGELSIERRIPDVRGHEGGHAGLDGRAERSQLDLLQAPRLVLDDRQLQMGIEARIPVPGKMLPARGQPLRFERADSERSRAVRLRPRPPTAIGRR